MAGGAAAAGAAAGGYVLNRLAAVEIYGVADLVVSDLEAVAEIPRLRGNLVQR